MNNKDFLSKINNNNNIFSLENEFVRLDFNKKTGCINSIINKTYDKDLLLFKEKTQIFRIVYAIQNYRAHHFDSNEQTIDNISIKKGDNKQTLEIIYNKLFSRRGVFNIQVKINIELENDSDEFIMNISVKNNDNGRVTQVWFPWVKGFTKISENPKEDLLAYPGQGGNLYKDP